MVEISVSWERQERESEKAYSYFCCYRDLGKDRSTVKVQQEFSKSKRFMDRLSSKHNWVERARAYDDYLEREIRKANEKELVETSKSLLNTVNKMLDLYTIPLEAIEKKLRAKNETGFEDITIKEIMTWVAQNGGVVEKLVKLKMLLEDKPQKIDITLETTIKDQLDNKDIIDVEMIIDEIRRVREVKRLPARHTGQAGEVEELPTSTKQ